MLDSAITVQEASDRPTVKRARGCRGRLAKRRSRERWLAKIGAEFISNSHQKKVLVDKVSTVAAVEAAEEPSGSLEKFGWGCKSGASSQNVPLVGNESAADSHWGVRAHLCCMAAGIVAVLLFVPVWAQEVAACSVVACGVASWATQREEQRNGQQLAAAVVKVQKLSKKKTEKMKLKWARVFDIMVESGVAGPAAMFRVLWEKAEQGRLEEKRLRLAEGQAAHQNLLRVKAELGGKQQRLQNQVREMQNQVREMQAQFAYAMDCQQTSMVEA